MRTTERTAMRLGRAVSRLSSRAGWVQKSEGNGVSSFCAISSLWESSERFSSTRERVSDPSYVAALRLIARQMVDLNLDRAQWVAAVNVMVPGTLPSQITREELLRQIDWMAAKDPARLERFVWNFNDHGEPESTYGEVKAAVVGSAAQAAACVVRGEREETPDGGTQ